MQDKLIELIARSKPPCRGPKSVMFLFISIKTLWWHSVSSCEVRHSIVAAVAFRWSASDYSVHAFCYRSQACTLRTCDDPPPLIVSEKPWCHKLLCKITTCVIMCVNGTPRIKFQKLGRRRLLQFYFFRPGTTSFKAVKKRSWCSLQMIVSLNGLGRSWLLLLPVGLLLESRLSATLKLVFAMSWKRIVYHW